MGDLSIFVLEDKDVVKEKEVEYRYWVSIGDFFHMLLADSTPTITYKDLQGDGGESQKEKSSDWGTMIKLVPLLVGLKIMKEIIVESTSDKASKVVEMFEKYLLEHVDIETDYDTEAEEEKPSQHV